VDKEKGDVILQMDQIVKSYGTLLAVDRVDLTLRKGEILALLGENGAGKTTLMKVLYGLVEPDSGDITINDKHVHIKNPTHAIAEGIGMVQQHFMLFDPFTVAENIVYSKEPRSKGVFFDIKKTNKLVAELSKKYELPLDPEAKILGMPVGLRQRVEILKVLYQNTDIIIFDEPTAVLTPLEVRELLQTMRHLAESGKSIVFVTHKLNEVMAVADQALVMRLGKLVGNVPVSETSVEELSFMMVGRHLAQQDLPEVEKGDDILRVENLCLKTKSGGDVLNDFSLHVAAGEIVGIAGVSGNGQSEFVECLFGLRRADSGSVKVKGEELCNLPVRRVRDAGVALIPEDRFIWGSAVDATIIETALMAHQNKSELSRWGLLRMKPIREFAQKLVDDFNVKTDNISFRTGSLSGGNTQKLIAGREIIQHTPLLVASEPTRGLDVGAIEYIHERLIEKRTNGDAVLLVSSELSEIIKLSDRIYVMYDGKINGEFTRGNVSEEELGLRMTGGVAQNADS
jgi:simple sugar transport system ATP-binding protein